MKRIRFIISLVTLTIGFTLLAQQKQNTDLVRIYEKYGKARFKMDIKYSFYHSYQATTPVEEQQMYLSAWENNVWMKSRDFELVRNEEQMIYVNKRDKLMILQPVEGRKLNALISEMQSLINMDSILSKYSNSMLRETNEDVKTYRINYGTADAKFAYVDMAVNTKKELIEQITVYFSKQMDQLFHVKDEAHKKSKPKMIITYSNCVFPQKIDQNDFSISRYLMRGNGGEKIAAAGYKTYRIIDQTVKQKRKKK